MAILLLSCRAFIRLFIVHSFVLFGDDDKDGGDGDNDEDDKEDAHFLFLDGSFFDSSVMIPAIVVPRYIFTGLSNVA